MEASTGIEPVYTDLQSIPLSSENSNLDRKWYQDIYRTTCEPDTIAIVLSVGQKFSDADQRFSMFSIAKKKIAGRVAALSDEIQKIIVMKLYLNSWAFSSLRGEVMS